MIMMMMRNACTWLTTPKKQLTLKRDHVLLRHISVQFRTVDCVQQTNGTSVYLSKWFSDLLLLITKKNKKKTAFLSR
jgi:hypothetical protein